MFPVGWLMPLGWQSVLLSCLLSHWADGDLKSWFIVKRWIDSVGCSPQPHSDHVCGPQEGLSLPYPGEAFCENTFCASTLSTAHDLVQCIVWLLIGATETNPKLIRSPWTIQKCIKFLLALSVSSPSFSVCLSFKLRMLTRWVCVLGLGSLAEPQTSFQIIFFQFCELIAYSLPYSCLLRNRKQRESVIILRKAWDITHLTTAEV